LSCAAPRNVYVPAGSSTGKVNVSWNRSLTAGVTYEVEMDSGSGYSYLDTLDGEMLGVSLPSGTYTFRVKAVKGGWADSAYTESLPVSVALTCAAPRSIAAPASSSTGTDRVIWKASLTPGVTYLLEESSDGGGSWGVVANNLTATYRYIVGQANGSYLYRVQASRTGYADSAPTTSSIVQVALP